MEESKNKIKKENDNNKLSKLTLIYILIILLLLFLLVYLRGKETCQSVSLPRIKELISNEISYKETNSSYKNLYSDKTFSYYKEIDSFKETVTKEDKTYNEVVDLYQSKDFLSESLELLNSLNDLSRYDLTCTECSKSYFAVSIVKDLDVSNPDLYGFILVYDSHVLTQYERIIVEPSLSVVKQSFKLVD